ncbi:MAG: cation transporter [Actinomycetota bacterium]|nr:cation transporter [Actinomycetota bacterium]
MAVAVEQRLHKRALRLEYFTITWNVIEAVVAIGAGVVAGSIALVGFGFDSSIEGVAASVVIWQLRGAENEEREQRALSFIAITFFILAAYVVFESVRDLASRAHPETSVIGIVVATASIIVMPTLGFAKKRVADKMGSAVLRADAAETFLCSWLSVILLGGLILNATVGWWWADPVAALGIAGLALREGLEAWSGNYDKD